MFENPLIDEQTLKNLTIVGTLIGSTIIGSIATLIGLRKGKIEASENPSGQTHPSSPWSERQIDELLDEMRNMNKHLENIAREAGWLSRNRGR